MATQNIHSLPQFDMVATTHYGMEQILADELKSLGVEAPELQNRAVKFNGSKYMLYKCNLCLRTAIKVLIPWSTFTVEDEEALYKKVKKTDWDQFFSPEQTFAIDANTHSQIFTHSKYVALKAKDAIADWFKSKYDKRPNVDPDNPDFKLNILISDKTCYLSLDSSGKPLGKRGYRTAQNLAPISENLAAGIILISGWKPGNDFVDPMCGSGTFSIEAAMIAANIPPGKKRAFTFQRWKQFSPEIWEQVKNDVEAETEPASRRKIFAWDKDRETINIARDNARRAGVEKMIRFREQDFMDSEAPGQEGTVVMNPPYGERMQENDIVEFYKSIGTQLKHRYQDYEAWIISSNMDALKHVGLKPSQKVKLYNGPLECRLHKFELYGGSKKGMKR